MEGTNDSNAVDHSHFPRPGENCAVFLFPCGGEDMGSAGLCSFLRSKKRRMDRSPGLGKTVQAWGDENGPAHYTQGRAAPKQLESNKFCPLPVDFKVFINNSRDSQAHLARHAPSLDFRKHSKKELAGAQKMDNLGL